MVSDAADISDTAVDPNPSPRAEASSPPYGFPKAPGIRQIDFADIRDALSEGWADFRAAPQFGVFFGAVFAVGGLILLGCLVVWDTPWAILPLAVAFPLLGPFVAVGLYEVSRRLTTGEPLTWRAVLDVVIRQKDRQLAWMGFVMLFGFWMWAYQVRLLLALFLGYASFSSVGGLLEVIATKDNGLAFLLTGSVVGAALALIMFSLTVMSTPLLVDRDVDIVTALVVSVAAVRRNAAPMLAWGAFVVAVLFLAMAPIFLGLVVVLPVLGHATWRLYEKIIVRETAGSA